MTGLFSPKTIAVDCMMANRDHSGEDRLHLLLGRLVHAFARFDFNLGLKLKWLGPYCGIDVDHLLSPRVPFTQRFEALKPLLLEVYVSADSNAHAEFSSWFVRAHDAKAMRNDYAHGRWGLFSSDEVEFVRLGWEMDPAKQAPSVCMHLDDFALEVLAIELLFAEFARLEGRFRGGARSPKK